MQSRRTSYSYVNSKIKEPFNPFYHKFPNFDHLSKETTNIPIKSPHFPYHPFPCIILNLNNRFNSETSWPNNKAALPTNSPQPAASPATPPATTRVKATPSTPTTTNTPAPMSTGSVRGMASTSTPMAIAMRARSWPIRNTGSAGSPPRRRESTTVRLG